MPRLTLEYNQDMEKILKALSDEEQVPKREIIRRALALYSCLSNEGVKIGGSCNLSITTKDDGRVVKDIIF